MSHDAMARGATPRQRGCFELNRAETHYLLAIASLNSQLVETVPTLYFTRPVSPAASEDGYEDGRSRRTSNASQQSFASSATSISEAYPEPLTPRKSVHQRTASLTPYSLYYSPQHDTRPKEPTAESEWAFLADLSSFRSVVRDHLRGIQELKRAMLPPATQPIQHHVHSRAHSYAHATSPRTHVYSPTHARSFSNLSPVPPATSHSRAALKSPGPEAHGDTMSRFADRRAKMALRPRFDPTDVQKLCNDALFELRR